MSIYIYMSIYIKHINNLQVEQKKKSKSNKRNKTK